MLTRPPGRLRDPNRQHIYLHRKQPCEIVVTGYIQKYCANKGKTKGNLVSFSLWLMFTCTFPSILRKGNSTNHFTTPTTTQKA